MWKELHDDIVKFKYIIEEAENGFYLRVQPSDSDDMVSAFWRFHGVSGLEF